MAGRRLGARAFASAWGRAILPYVTIGLFQWRPPHARTVTGAPVSGRYTRSPPPPGSYTKRRVSTTTGLVPAFGFCPTCCSWPVVNRHATVPPPSAAKTQVPTALRSTAGALNTPPVGVDTACASPPRCGVVPAIAPQLSTRISASFPPCATRPPPSSTGDVEPRSVSLESSAPVFVGV